jgi:hypothetical protein
MVFNIHLDSEGRKVMNAKFLICVLILTCLGLSGYGNTVLANEEGEREPQVGFTPKVVADYIHAIIEAERALYTTHVVDRMYDEKIVIATESWKERKALPLPAQMTKMAGQVVALSGMGLRFRLASLWPIYEENGPADVFEETGLKVVAEDPEEVYTGIIKRGDKRFFKAIYADKAVSKACVNCHNGHILSSKRDRKLGDVLGGIIISFPLPLEK